MPCSWSGRRKSCLSISYPQKKEKEFLKDALNMYFILKITFIESLIEHWLYARNMYFACMIAIISTGWKKGGMTSLSLSLSLRCGRWVSKRQSSLSTMTLITTARTRPNPQLQRWGTLQACPPLETELHSSLWLSSCLPFHPGPIFPYKICQAGHEYLCMGCISLGWRARFRPKVIGLHFKIRIRSWKN